MTPPDLTALFGGNTWIGIVLAILSGVALSLGTQFQHRGVAVVEERHGDDGQRSFTLAHFRGLLARPSWLIGTLLLGLAIVLQLASLWFAPLTVVQPLGAVALVITAIMNARLSRTRLTGKAILAIVLCVGGVGLFVTLAASYAHLRPVTSNELTTVLIALGALVVLWGVLYAVFRKSPHPLFYIVAAGTLFGFLATLAKVVIGRIQTLIDAGWQFGAEEWLTILCIAGLILATVLGGWFVQNAHLHGPPDLVVAGLTVIDPIVAVTIGAVVLGELQAAPVWAVIGMLAMGVVAVVGVYFLARQHPHMQDGRYDTGPVPRVPAA
ncbi:MAG: multidrug DMT transporter permease [Microbacteriaceae bacterium]|nr:multidrug DMT transporter permease [Microbacteriaceae bacterium]